MNNVLLWIGGLLVVILGALFAGPHFVDWTLYRGVFEEEASRVLGREVRVAGAVNLRLLPTPYVRFEKVRLSDAAGQTGEPFFRADDFTLWLAPAPLLRGAIEARELELRRPTLKLRFDANGGGNWQTLSIARGQLPFVPSDVALQSVLITDGTISVDGADGNELVRVAAISGELSVAALEGPFRFKGSFDMAGVGHELKASTTAFEADGGLRFKAQLTIPSSSNGYTLDGRLSDLSGRAKLDGQLTGQLAFVPGNIGRSAAAIASSTAKPTALVPVELRAAVAADTSGANFSDLGLAFEQDGKPQLVSGAAQVGWNGGLDVKSEWNARWLDFDGGLGQAAGTTPLEAVRRLAAALGGLVPASGRGVSKITVDQLTLGGDALSDARLRIERDNDTLRLAELRVNLPGGTRAQISGVFPQGTAAETFDGDITLRGANLSRLLTWAGHGAAVAEGRTEGAFSLRSKLGFDPQTIAIKDAFASIGGAVLNGGITYRWAERPRLDIVLEGDQIDLTLVSPQALDLMARAREFAGLANDAPAAAKSPAASRYAIDPKTQDLTLRIRAGRLIDTGRDLRDVDVDAALIGGRLSLQRMRFTSGAGLDLEADGDIADVGGRSRGALRGTVSVADETAVAELLELFDAAGDAGLANRLRPIAPARVAWAVKFAEPRASGQTPVEIWLDGVALGRRLAGSARLDGGFRDWRRHALQMNVAIERPDWQRLRSLLAIDAVGSTPGTSSAAAAAGATGVRGKLLLNASGRPDQGLSTYIKLEDEAFDAGISGRITLDAGTIASADGELQLRSSDAAQALAALGFPARNLPGIAIEGAAELSFKDDKVKITPSALEVAGAIIGGELTATRVKDRFRLDGRLTASQANIPRLLDLLVDGKTAGARDTDRNLWQSAAFDFSALDRIEGRVRLEAGELGLTPELALSRAVIDAEFGPGKVDFVSLEGDLLGSRLTSRWLVEKAAAGANLSGNVKVAGIRLDLLGGSQLAPAQRMGGAASVTAVLNGRGLTPRGLVGALAGKGEIDVAKSDAGSPPPTMVRRIADEVIGAKREATVGTIEQAVLAKLKVPAVGAKLGLGTRKLGFDIADGALKVRAFTVETPDGIAANRTTIDLATLMIDSEWKIEERFDKPVRATPTPGTKPVTALPPITIVFIGPLAALGRLEPVVSVEALVRELGVRRMERDVDELERLRRLDEARAHAEAERLRAEAAARAAAAAAAANSHLQPAAGPPHIIIPPIPVPATPPAASVAPRVEVGPSIPDQAAAETTNTIADQPPAPEPRRRPATAPSGLTSEPRQVPSSQRAKKSWMQDVFRGQGMGGN